MAEAKIQFTPAQAAAIQARGGSLLVSAAAGSGKTRVLVERVAGLITDPDHPVDADSLLIMTFTNAAAAKLRADITMFEFFQEFFPFLLRHILGLYCNFNLFLRQFHECFPHFFQKSVRREKGKIISCSSFYHTHHIFCILTVHLRSASGILRADIISQKQ